jgi:hypothetical protein
MCLEPRATFIDLTDDMEEIALLKRELLGGRGTIRTGCADDFLRRGGTEGRP